ncbi:helix-turn-helix domain-containing protein [Streptomyces sp. NBC_01498]|uniref:ArsR/SmtB family transcription factor n=1 Tax=Streptomyces sp. NBC_01498 TaxID=2975870 RepID=UPI002E7C560F|nr:ArsR family transcriptional regulator [Streptomyces sp. NBC_01498]WTL26023.1 helix-turn-helix domain-containing protein [Streptomyces sp. NBC_01498]
MELEDRVAALERRLAALERGEPEEPASRPRRGERPGRPADDTFRPLELLEEQLTAADAESGGVMYAGSVRLPAGQSYAWQFTELTGDILDADWAESADSFAALGHGVRLRLLREILGGLRTAAELAGLDDIGTTGQIYHHLRQLTGAGWLRTTGRGRYEVPAPRVVPLLVMLSATRN